MYCFNDRDWLIQRQTYGWQEEFCHAYLVTGIMRERRVPVV